VDDWKAGRSWVCDGLPEIACQRETARLSQQIWTPQRMPFPPKKSEGSPAEERGESPATERAENRSALEKKKGGKKGVAVHEMPRKVEQNELFMPQSRT
jgi:hypothetical protein